MDRGLQREKTEGSPAAIQSFVSIFLSIVHIDIDVIDIDDLEELAFLADETFGKRGPLDSVLKLEMLMRACKSSTGSIEFALLCMCDSCLNRTVVPSEMTPNWLFGKGSQKG